jgi:hypothetical protein
LPFYHNNFIAKNFQQFALGKISEQHHMYSLFIATVMKTQATTHCCLKLRWESLRGWDFGPQLVVVSGPFGGNPFVDGILGHNLLFHAFSVGIPSWMEF